MNYYTLTYLGVELARAEFEKDDFKAARDRIWARLMEEQEQNPDLPLQLHLTKTECIHDTRFN